MLADLDMGRYTEAERRWAVWLMVEPQLVEVEYTTALTRPGEADERHATIWRRKLEVAPILASEIQGRFTKWRIQGVTRVLDQYVDTRRGEVQYRSKAKAYDALIKIHVRANREIQEIELRRDRALEEGG